MKILKEEWTKRNLVRTNTEKKIIIKMNGRENVCDMCWNLTSKESILCMCICDCADRHWDQYVQPKCSTGIFFFRSSISFSLCFSRFHVKVFIVVFVHITFDLSRHTRHVFFRLLLYAAGCFNSFLLVETKTDGHPDTDWYNDSFVYAALFFFYSPYSDRCYASFLFLTHTHFPWPGFCLCPLLDFFFH